MTFHRSYLLESKLFPGGNIQQILYWPCSRGDVESVRELLRNPMVDVNGDHGLHVACQHGHFDVVILLLMHPDIDLSKRRYRRTARELVKEGATTIQDLFKV